MQRCAECCWGCSDAAAAAAAALLRQHLHSSGCSSPARSKGLGNAPRALYEVSEVPKNEFHTCTANEAFLTTVIL